MPKIQWRERRGQCYWDTGLLRPKDAALILFQGEDFKDRLEQHKQTGSSFMTNMDGPSNEDPKIRPFWFSGFHLDICSFRPGAVQEQVNVLSELVIALSVGAKMFEPVPGSLAARTHLFQASVLLNEDELWHIAVLPLRRLCGEVLLRASVIGICSVPLTRRKGE